MRLAGLVALVAALAAAAITTTTTTTTGAAAATITVVESAQYNTSDCSGPASLVHFAYAKPDGSCTPRGSIANGAGWRANCAAGTLTTYDNGICVAAPVDSLVLNTCGPVVMNATNKARCVDVDAADVFMVESFTDQECSVLYGGVGARFNACMPDLATDNAAKLARPSANGSIVMSLYANGDSSCSGDAVGTKLVTPNVCTLARNEQGKLPLFTKVTVGMPWAPAFGTNTTTNGTKTPTKAPSGAAARFAARASLMSVLAVLSILVVA